MKITGIVFLVIASLALVLFGLSLIRLPESDPRSVRGGEVTGAVGLAELPLPSSDDNSMTGLLLQDPTPLFLPTQLNSGRVDAAMTTERSPGTSFGPIPAKLLFSETDVQLAIPEVVAIPSSALSVVVDDTETLALTELSRADLNSKPLRKRDGRLEVLSVSSGRALWSVDIAESSFRAKLEAPWELLLAVTSSGSIGNPTVVNAGEGNGIDLGELSKVLEETHLGARLTPGIYRILLGP